MATIDIRGVRKSYGKTEVVHGVDLTVRSGEFVVVLGPSGCGKSTLLRMVAGLEAISGGEIAIDGRVVNALEPRERGCAMVFQNYALYPHMTVAENVGYALKVAGVPKAARAARVRAVVEPLGLVDYLDRKPAQLSGGQRQRVAMGRAMIREPKVFLYDEPLSNLDARLRVSMRVEIRKLHRRLGATTLFVTHDQVEAMTLADRIVVMNAGRIEQVGTPTEIYHRPASTYVAGFVGNPGMTLIEGVLDPRSATVVMRDGQSIPYDRARWPEATKGRVVVGLRAETVRPGAGGPTGTVEFAEELGPARLLHVACGRDMLVAEAPTGAGHAIGAPVALRIDPAAVHLFDPLSGRRLPDEGGVAPARARPPATVHA